MTAKTSPDSIGIVLYPGAQLSVIHGLTDLFSIAVRTAAEVGSNSAARLEFSHWNVPASGTPPIICVHQSEAGRGLAPGILIIPPTMVELPVPQVRDCFSRWLIEQNAEGVRLISICSGIKLLAETGLIDGRVVSTHRNCAEYLIHNFPEIIVDLDERIIEYPDILTAGGFMSWIDVGLLLVERSLGDHVREETARFILSDPSMSQLTPPRRFMPPMSHGDLAVRRAQQHIHLNDGQGICMISMAKAARLERRTFIRRFVAATGTTPAAYCRDVRIARARELLESGNLAQKEIARRLGYTDVSTFARAFRRTQGIAPGTYRKQYGKSYVSGAN